MIHRLFAFLFPPKCILCRKLLRQEETDLCHDCRKNAPVVKNLNFRIPFVAGWTGIWYYKDNVRNSLLRYKFYNTRSYAQAYSRLLAMKVAQDQSHSFDLITWVPISRLRRIRRGYDQVEILAQAVGKELGISPTSVLKKIRNTPPQSTIKDAAQRRANVLDAYRVTDPSLVVGKEILLLDDVLTTGATASECAKMLMIAGAKCVHLATIAVASHNSKQK